MESTKQSVDEFLSLYCCDLDVQKNVQPNKELNPDSKIQIQVTKILEDKNLENENPEIQPGNEGNITQKTNSEILPGNEGNIIQNIDSKIQQHSEELGKIKLENEELKKNVESLEKSNNVTVTLNPDSRLSVKDLIKKHEKVNEPKKPLNKVKLMVQKIEDKKINNKF